MIAVTFLAVGPQPAVGYALLLVGVVLAASRFLLGVHFISDVVSGAVFGIFAGAVGYLLLI